MTAPLSKFLDDLKVAANAGSVAEFEAWYAATHPVSFRVLFENEMPETPRVDF